VGPNLLASCSDASASSGGRKDDSSDLCNIMRSYLRSILNHTFFNSDRTNSTERVASPSRSSWPGR
jgi:hypothetical protein